MFTKTFTDPQGVTHTDAIFETSSANLNNNSSESFDFRISEGDNAEAKKLSTYSSSNMSYQMFYWASQDARDAGNLPYILANTQQIGQSFEVPDELLQLPEYKALSAALQAEKHCQEVVLA